MRPPLGLTGIRPPISMSPASIACQLWPGGVMPKWSMAMYSVLVKQSCVSMPSIASTPGRPRLTSLSGYFESRATPL